MNLPFFIAKRYLLSRKKTNIINLISGISVVGVSVGTLALVVVMSVFNGFNGLVKSLFSSFDPDLKIEAAVGKTFDANTAAFQEVRNLSEIAIISETVEENALLRYGKQQYPATVKGVGPEFQHMTGIDTMVTEGKFILEDENFNYTVIGSGVAYYLSVGLTFIHPIHLYYPEKGRKVSINIASNFNHDYIFPSGIFTIQQDLDNRYMIVPIDFARNLFDVQDKVSSLEIKLADGTNPVKVQDKISDIIGPDYVVKTRYQQHDYLYKIMQSEKWAVYLILVFILIIASFNIVGSLTMLILDKRDDIDILRSMGAHHSLIRRIFLFEGWSISFLGAIIGTILGLLVCWVQKTFGLLQLQGGDSFIISAYPVEIVPLDIAAIFVSVLIIGFLAAWFPVRYISLKYMGSNFH